VKSSFSIIFTLIILFSIGSCKRKDGSNFTESFEDFGISMLHPKFEKLESYGFDQKHLPATDNSGVLMAGSKEHTITLFWFTNPFPGEMKTEEEYSNMKLRLASEVAQWERAEQDFKVNPGNYLTSPVGHRVFFQTWSYKDASARVYGATSVWYCKQSRRIFQLNILNTSENNDSLIRKYLDGFKCHG